ncbi:hypothetical protein LTR94_024470 [Friedmanniomyces endolithicus]|nr:hypothetical protein LTR94_024470 [Friedmanniomyces endolithicus]
MLIQDVWRKITSVLCDNDIGSHLDGGRKNVAIIGIGQAQSIDRRLGRYGPIIRNRELHLPNDIASLVGLLGGFPASSLNKLALDLSAPAYRNSKH